MMRGLRTPGEGQEIQLDDLGAVPVTEGESKSSVYSVRSQAAKWLSSWPKVSEFRLRRKGFALFKRKKPEPEETPFLSRSLPPSPAPANRQRGRRFDLGNGSHLCILLVILVFLLNLILAIWGAAANLERENGLVVVHRGTCSWTKNANSALHIVINILASALLGASSYMMQRLAAPTRDDIDRLHEKHKSVWIGSLSYHCFSYMNKRKLVIFFIFWTSSIPIHLLYNTVFVTTTTDAQTPSYSFLLSEEGIEELQRENMSAAPALPRTQIGFSDFQDLFDPSGESKSGGEYLHDPGFQQHVKWVYDHGRPLERLEVSDCIDAYASGASIDRGDVILVSANIQQLLLNLSLYEETLSGWVLKRPLPIDFLRANRSDESNEYYAHWEWMCLQNASDYSDLVDLNCTPQTLIREKEWVVESGLVAYCLSRKMPPSCELNMSLWILLVVLVCNAGKLLGIYLTMFLCTDHVLLTTGDAISSFLVRENSSTKGLCTASDAFILMPWRYGQRSWNSERSSFAYEVEPWRRRDGSLWQVARGLCTMTICTGLIALASCAFFLYWTIHQTSEAYQDAGFHFGFNQMVGIGLGNEPTFRSSSTVASFAQYSGAWSKSKSVFLNGVIFANLPQLPASLIYFIYNSLFTRFFSLKEWNSYSGTRRGLRVTNPMEGTSQTSTYYLQFPLRYSVPLLAWFALMHWLISETLFLRRIYAIWPEDTAPRGVGKFLISRLAYSPIALFWLTLALLVLALIGFAIIHASFEWKMPPNSGKSVTISAASHPPKNDDDVHLSAVRWGVTSMGRNGIGHCSFSGLPVRSPEQGEKFMGRA